MNKKEKTNLMKNIAVECILKYIGSTNSKKTRKDILDNATKIFNEKCKQSKIAIVKKTESRSYIGMALNVLLVDDEYLVLKGLEIILSEQAETSVIIVTAMDVEDALNKLTSFRPDVIITDINMPESNGFELIKQAQQNFPHCRFILCSGYDEQSYLKQALHLHVDDYLLKPIDKSLLIHRLKELEVEKERNISHVLMRIQLLLLN